MARAVVGTLHAHAYAIDSPLLFSNSHIETSPTVSSGTKHDILLLKIETLGQTPARVTPENTSNTYNCHVAAISVGNGHKHLRP